MRRAFAALAFAVAAAAQAADPVAFVADLKGNATIEGDGKVVFLAELAPGTRLLLGSMFLSTVHGEEEIDGTIEAVASFAG